MRAVLKYAILTFLCAFASQAKLVTAATLADASSAQRIDHDVAVVMRDGTILRADVYRPLLDGEYPVIVERTPYGKFMDVGMGALAASRGYMYVAQDCRGRYTSAGSWYPYRYEANDGFDTVEWAAKLPGSDGRVIAHGGSYAGMTALAAAAARPPHLIAVDVIESTADYYDGWSYDGGVLRQLFMESWASVLARSTIPEKTRRYDEMGHNWVFNRDKAIDQYPIEMNIDSRTAPFFHDFLQHSSLDSYWKDFAVDVSRIDVPLFMIGGWYDLFTSGTVHTFLAYQRKDTSAPSRVRSQLVIGPWTHGGFEAVQGEYAFGPEAKRDVLSLIFAWVDANAKPDKNTKHQPLINYFEMGTNTWRETPSWPPATAASIAFPLTSSGHANTSHGDGVLLLSSTDKASGSDTFPYDPKNPVETVGGGLCCGVVTPGAFDQGKAEMRSDKLVYSSDLLKENLELTGDVHVRLFVKSSAVDTDFTAKLVDVMADGKTRNVADSIFRLRHRKSLEATSFLKPGDAAEIDISLGPTSNVFLAGHRIRVEISSSNFPRYARNLNTRDDGYLTTVGVPAINTVLHDARHPSALILTGGNVP